MRKIDPTVLGIIFLTIVIFGGILITNRSASTNNALSYNLSSNERPKLEISKKNFSMGNINVNDTKTEDISIKNTGIKPLILSNFSTSCDCTYGQLIIDDDQSPKFTMGKSSWSKELAPDEIAKLSITYKPSIMPVDGEVSRVVYFKTNDPENTNVEIKFNAFVSK
ncbi:MAG: hypothetical protein ACD_58C00200G0002 [uncultured bacterium]|nr:MAG: hypothetical protein ACD_58C00200G0002 [uncultured bacterium]